ncbi:3'(2'),5'-bisphosphate nucleotidase 1 [Nymphon striatum]|nr:3'(2'),5'-bisphosphate nucleotidase 1 [Nymphon striatum]
MSSPFMLRLLAAGVNIANQAGNIVRHVMSSGQLGIVDKGINDLQTQADRSTQKSIVASFAHQFPNVTVIGEETLDSSESITDEWIVKGQCEDVLKVTCPAEFLNVQPEDIVIWVDPLDGTAEYTQGLLDHVTVLIGISVKGRSVAGIIHQPYYNYQNESDPLNLGRTMWGIIGAGIHGIKQEAPPEGKRILTTTRSHLTPEVTAALDAMSPDDIIRVGGAGHKLIGPNKNVWLYILRVFPREKLLERGVLLLIEGKAHAYVFASPGCKKWDTCAPEALLHAVGGRLTDMHGSLYQYDKDVKHRNSGGVLATAYEKNHQWYLERVPETVKSSLPA